LPAAKCQAAIASVSQSRREKDASLRSNYQGLVVGRTADANAREFGISWSRESTLRLRVWEYLRIRSHLQKSFANSPAENFDLMAANHRSALFFGTLSGSI